jgi:hypothetical protein
MNSGGEAAAGSDGSSVAGTVHAGGRAGGPSESGDAGETVGGAVNVGSGGADDTSGAGTSSTAGLGGGAIGGMGGTAGMGGTVGMGGTAAMGGTAGSSGQANGGASGAGGAAVGPAPVCTTVGKQDFETTAADGSWVVDNSAAQAGTQASHPPILAAGATASMKYTCGGKPSTQLTFSYRGAGPTDGQRLRFYVDGTLYATYAGTPNGVGGYPFYQVQLTLPDALHEFRWDATTSVGGQPPFWVDSITCAESGPLTNATGLFAFEDCFVPPELPPAANDAWQIDNSSHQGGAMSAHPPALAGGSTASMAFSCGDKPHSQLSFYYQGIGPTAGQTLKFYVDDTLYQTYAGTPNGVGGWPFYNVTLTVPTGKHKYRWDATTNVGAQPPYWIDSITCANNPEASNTTGQFGFEEGFVPPELPPAAMSPWQIDNSSHQAGALAIHPPVLSAGVSSSASFTCGGKEHSQLSFYYQGIAPTAGQTLKFYVDDVLYQTFAGTPNGVGGWPYYNVTLTVPTGTHKYRWDAVSNTGGQPPYWLDSITCSNNPSSANATGQFGFEEGFVPAEIPPAATNAWQIDNSSHQAGALAIHPPKIAAAAVSSMTFSCGGLPHSQLSFYYQGIGPSADQTLKFYVDDLLYQTYAGTPNGVGGWPYYNVTLTVPTGTHTYRWDVTGNSAAQPPYWLDSIVCSNNPTIANTTGQFGFEEGFVPLEIPPSATNPWQIDNSSHQAGSLSAHPPSLLAGGTSSLIFTCGGKTHSKLSFYYQGVAPTAGETLKLYVDGTLYQTYGNTPNGVGGYPFALVTLTLASGTHAYRWDATTDVAAMPPYWLDTIQCQ